MKKLGNFVSENQKLDPIDGKSADKNRTKQDDGIKWGLNEPVDNTALDAEDIDPKTLSKNKKRLYEKFEAEEPFFIMGEAGWGKTSVIKDMAKKFHREVVTVYLDKKRAEDLEGAPTPVEDKKHKLGVKNVKPVPEWANVIQENPDVDFLLFFDEMNQAQSDVMNALMPIVLDNNINDIIFDNIMVGAAGNFDWENDEGINEMSTPLKQRFMPIIIWESRTPEAWKETFDHFRNDVHWDEKLSPKVVDALEANAQLFASPRIIEHKILKFCYTRKEKLDAKNREDHMDVEDYLDRLKGLLYTEDYEELKRSEKDDLAKLAETIYNFMHNKDDESKSRRGRGEEMKIPDNLKEAIEHGMRYGYIEDDVDDSVKWGFSRENMYVFVDDKYANGEMIDRLVRKFEADGIKFKFEKDEEWKKKGYKDPKDFEE